MDWFLTISVNLSTILRWIKLYPVCSFPRHWRVLSCVSDCIRIRHPAGHHGEGRTEQLAGQCHLRRKLQRCQLQTTAGGSGPETGEEVCDRPWGRETAEHAGTGDATMTSALRLIFLCVCLFIFAVQKKHPSFFIPEADIEIYISCWRTLGIAHVTLYILTFGASKSSSHSELKHIPFDKKSSLIYWS